MTETVEMMDPAPPDEVLQACRSLRYRDHIGVHLQYDGNPFPDNWIYVHDKRVHMARLSNYRTFSPEMADRDNISPLTVEYFTFEGDEVWSQSDEDLVALAGRELQQVGVADPKRIVKGFVIRSKKAYPVIGIGFQDHIKVIKSWLDRLENFLPIGRSGMFKYNNQDHAIATGLLAVRTVLGLGHYDPWQVNIDAEYHEGGQAPVIASTRHRPAVQQAALTR